MLANARCENSTSDSLACMDGALVPLDVRANSQNWSPSKRSRESCDEKTRKMAGSEVTADARILERDSLWPRGQPAIA